MKQWRWYQDVDGPLNPWRSHKPHKRWADYAKHTVVPDPVNDPTVSYRLWFSPLLGTAITEIVDRHDIEFVWATTWGPHLDTITDLANLGHGHRALDFDTFETDPAFGACSKLPAVIADAGDHPIIWFDDDIGRREKQWASDRTDSGIPTLLWASNPSIGISRQDLDLVVDLISRA